MLSDAGIDFISEPARIDEMAVKASLLNEGANPQDIADALAELKALRISARYPDAMVIGSDQVLELKGQILNKPETHLAARQQLISLRNKTHKLLAAVVIVKNSTPQWRFVGKARLHMRDFSDEFLDTYMANQGGSILQSVGAYRLESEGARLFSKIDGDFFTILGMPLIETLNYLSDTGTLAK